MDFIMIAIRIALFLLILISYTSQCQQRFRAGYQKKKLTIKRQRWIIIM
jgi:hypothetical protein